MKTGDLFFYFTLGDTSLERVQKIKKCVITLCICLRMLFVHLFTPADCLYFGFVAFRFIYT